MVPKEAAGSGGGGGGSGEENKDAKHVLDEFGQQVYETVEKDDEAYKEALKGKLQHATNINQKLIGTADTCDLVEDYYNNHVKGGVKGKRYPCTELGVKVEVNRFSDTLGGQCTNEKMRSDGIGACAPYRRLHLCHHNLETIDTTSTTHDLLLEVCMAAKYEGDSIKTNYTIHEHTNPDSQICTVLARSFADIGDIVRGKDLFYGNKQEKEKRDELDKKLKEIFEKIHKEVTSDKNGKNGKTLQERYKEDPNKNYFQLREDWWYANRKMVWRAITCGDAGGKYFRGTCVGRNSTNEKCRCPSHKVPTYFDYVPQFLRWFEEWAEDFCRLRKRKLEDAIKKCRGKKGKGGEKLYCDLNRYDCTKTASGKHDFFEEDDCKDCQYSCAPFVDWIDNQKLEFLKQRNKYTKEITRGGGRKKRGASGATTKVYDGYEKKFYDKFKSGYSEVNKFLEKLNKEDVCTKNTDIEEGGTIDFKSVHSGKHSTGSTSGTNDASQGTFYRTKYCEACPWCGAEKVEGGGWKAKNVECAKEVTKEYNEEDTTTIEILTADNKKFGIYQKYKKFCEKGAPGKKDKQIVTWQCHYDDSNKNSGQNNNNCVQGEWKEFKKVKNVMPYNPFFWDWVHDMLHDSLEWKTELDNCINNESKPCKKNKCNDKCKCYESWVKQKGEEWKNIVKHFKKQKDIDKQGPLAAIMTPDIILELLLEEDELLEIIEGTYGKSKETEHIKKLLKEGKKKNQEASFGGGVTEQKSTIVELLKYEKGIAKQCIEKHKCPDPTKQPAAAPGRSETSPNPTADPSPRDHTEDSEEEDDEDKDELQDTTAEDQEAETEPATEVKESEPVVPPTTDTTTPQVNPCEIVQTLFGDKKNLQEACNLKYGPGGKEKFPNWKCIPTEKPGEATSGKSVSDSSGSGATTERAVRVARGAVATTTSSDSGSICVPPRRRKLYLGGFDKFISDKLPLASTSASTSPSSHSRDDDLLKAFVESAAVETFFLWHKYKVENTKRQSGGVAPLPLPPPGLTDDDKDKKDPQEELQSGKIPDGFLRQMFYTISDYRDILVGNTDIVIKGSSEEDKTTMEAIQKKIKQTLESDNNQETRDTQQQTDIEKRKDWWDKNAKYIWEGMICALTYKDNGEKGQSAKIEQDSDLKKKLWDEKKKKPKDNPHDYTYEKVELKEEKQNGPMSTGAKPAEASTTSDTPLLSDFVVRPPYFRYLEEWGESFCRERTRRLAKIKEECKVDNTHYKCSGDGEQCDRTDTTNGVFADLEGRSCANSCRSYKKWIKKKRTEYDEQEKAYKEQKTKCQSKSEGGDNGFCGTPETTSTEAKDFLKTLVPCKKHNGEDNNKIFEDIKKTFGHENYCDPCSQFTVDCENGACGHSNTQKKCNGITPIDARDIAKMITSTEGVFMTVSDNSDHKFDDGLEACAGAGIFEGIKENKWKCGKVCGLDVCGLKSDNGKNYDQIILIRAFIERWLEYFLEDYNKIRKKLKPCMNSSDATPCIKGCAEEWLKKKKKEWKKIKEHYQKQYGGDDSDNSFPVKTILETLIPRMDLVNDKGKVTKLSQFDNSCGCKAYENTANGKNEDAIECLIDKLEKEATSCPDQPSGENLAQCKEYTPPVEDDEEDLLLEENENPVGKHPSFCNIEKKAELMEEVETCGENDEKKDEQSTNEKPAAPEVPGPTAESEEQTPVLKPEEEAPPPEPTPPTIQPPQADQPTNSISDILSSTIPFGIAIALTSIVFLFLKVIHIVVYICIYICVFCICMCGYVWIYICVYVCILYIFHIYLCIYIENEKNEKNEKKKKRI